MFDHLDVPHFMIDIETLSTEPEAVVLSIGVVYFNIFDSDIKDKFYSKLELDTQLSNNRKISNDTLLWWVLNNKEAFKEALINQEYCVKVLTNMNTFIESYVRNETGGKNKFHVWANDPRFDLVILEHLMKQLNIKPVWNHTHDLSFRSLKKFTNLRSDQIFENKVQHNALTDAIEQAKAVQRMAEFLGFKTGKC